MKDVPYDQKYMELMAKWPHCTLHHGHCYITKGGSHTGEHFNFEPREWGMWGSAMVNKQAVVEYPPRTIEFDQILEKHHNAKSKGKKKATKAGDRSRSTSSESDFGSKHKHVIVNVTQPALLPPVRRYSNPTSPSKVSTKQMPVVELLRTRGYEPKDYNDKALKDYFTWCKRTLPGDYDKAYELLSEHEIGIDMFDIVPDASALSSATKIKFGIAARILKHYREWLTINEDNSG
jgi:hypothetical protein